MRSRFADDELLTQGLVADILSVSKETVRKWEKRGTIASVNANAEEEPLYRWADLHAFPQVQAMLQSSWEQESQVLPARRFRSVELFAGAGGLALGLEAAGFDSVAFNEIDHDACDTLRENRPEWNVIEGDIETIDFTQFHDIDLVSGGFPCQAFSYAGNRYGFDGTRGTLFFQFARAIREMQPKIFLGENVRGLLTHDKGKTIEVIKGAIKEIGYTLIEPEVLKALFYRVPQKRERLFLVGIRNDLAHHQAKFKWPDPAQRVYTLRDALKKGDLFSTDVPESEGVLYADWKAELIEQIPQGGYWRDLPVPLQKKLLKGSFHLGGGKTGIGRRLSWNEPSLTLTCAPAQNQTGRCHPEETRPLTVREYARIQTFPDDWVLCGSMMSQYKQIGNAVPVNLAVAVARRLVALLNEMEAS
ncbi:MAG: DNA (cytosine-5-)-methyltransferase [Kiritimatiellia bacterium]|jgi:DNA (cytosine-5)-methyltransferase 1|uniref:DNA (cytosine-5-)-methyltransferase n=1 Tax=Atribacter sp. TaxID=2847780 RepID=UPI003D966660